MKLNCVPHQHADEVCFSHDLQKNGWTVTGDATFDICRGCLIKQTS